MPFELPKLGTRVRRLGIYGTVIAAGEESALVGIQWEGDSPETLPEPCWPDEFTKADQGGEIVILNDPIDTLIEEVDP